MILDKIKIAAPICSIPEAQAVIAAGADEVYCGAMFDDWGERFGHADLLSRRQGRQSHIRTPKELAQVAQIANKANCTAALTINARYTREQEKMVLDLAARWEDMGGHAVMVSDLGILLALAERQSHLKKYLSLLTTVFNAMSVHFFAGLGVSRVVLPRDLTVDEIRSLITNGPPSMAYELLVMNQKCQFIDGMCHFYHDLRLPTGIPSSFDYEPGSPGAFPEVMCHDPDYEGHGCQIPWQTDRGPVLHLHRDDWNTPYCAACLLPQLANAGVHCFKIAGRAYPLEIITRSVSFIRKAMDIWRSGEGTDNIDNTADIEEKIKQLYAQTFKNKCSSRCYYTITADSHY